MKLSEIKANPNNPRVIKDDRFQKLVKSILEFPKMMELRPMVINSDNVVLGGNMRLKALHELKYKEIPDSWVKCADELTEDEQRRFIIADNVGFGEHDWEVLGNEWDTEQLEEWGLDMPNNGDDSEYTTKVESPIYQPKTEKPKINELYNKQRYNELIEQINNSPLEELEKEFLKDAATRFIEFNYRNIAEYYSHSDCKTQEIMENMALIIIDYNKAIELGFVKLNETLEILAEND